MRDKGTSSKRGSNAMNKKDVQIVLLKEMKREDKAKIKTLSNRKRKDLQRQ